MKKYLKYVIMNKIQELISSYELNRAMATVDILFDELNPLGRSVCLFSAYVSSARMYFQVDGDGRGGNVISWGMRWIPFPL